MSAATSKMNRRAFLALGGGSALALVMPSIAFGAPAVRTMEGRAFATEWSITVPADVDMAPLRGPIERMLAGIDVQMSPWRADSDVTRFNRAAAGTMPMPAELVRVTAAALGLAGVSGGEFDPTVGPLVARWGFGPIKGDSVPDWRGIGLDGDAVSKVHDGLTLDLCGIAKGYALDRMAEIVRGAGHGDFLIDLGGELASSGTHPSGRAWHVAVEDPRPGVAGAVEVLDLGGMSVATSGSRANSYEIGRRRYSHIIDPLDRRARRQRSRFGVGDRRERHDRRWLGHRAVRRGRHQGAGARPPQRRRRPVRADRRQGAPAHIDRCVFHLSCVR